MNEKQKAKQRLRTPKKLVLEDIIDHSSHSSTPFLCPSSNKHLNKTAAHLSPVYKACTPKPRGLMQKNVFKRLSEYQKLQKTRSFYQGIPLLRAELFRKEMFQVHSPKISKSSKTIFYNSLEKRNLSPQVLERFEQYSQQKQRNKIAAAIQRFYCLFAKLPKAEDIIRISNNRDYHAFCSLIRQYEQWSKSQQSPTPNQFQRQ